MSSLGKKFGKPYFSLILLTIGIIALLAILMAKSVPPITRVTQSYHPSLPQSRLPASPMALVTSIDPSVLALDCTADLDSVIRPTTVKSSKLRIRGRRCGRFLTPNPSAITIRNNSNGYEASILPLSDTEFTTDYLSLSVGENEITVQMQADGGPLKTNTLRVTSSVEEKISSW